MAIVQIDNPQISADFHNHQATVAREHSEYSSIAQRLMRRAHSNTITVFLDDGLEIEVYTPTDSDVIELLKLQTDIFRAGTSMLKQGVDLDSVGSSVDAVADGYDRLNKLLGKLCVDTSLSYEFFASGMISASDKGAIISGIMGAVNQKREMVANFR